MKSKLVIYIIFILAVIIISGGCQKKTIEIGVVGTMTGNQSDLSVSGRRGVELAIEHINDNGGIDGKLINLVIKDDLNDKERAKEIVKEFVKEGVQIVIGHYTSGEMIAAYDELTKQDILYLGPTISADSLSEKDDNFIRFIASTKEQADIIIKVAFNKNLKNFMVVIDEKNIGFNEMLYKNFKERLKEGGGTVAAKLTYETLDDASIDKIINEIKLQKDLDGLFIISNATDLATITTECRKWDIDSMVFGPLWAHTDDLLRVGGQFVEGVCVVSGIDYDNNSEEFKAFKNAFYDKYGEEVTFSSIYSYETMMALSETLKAVGNTNPEEVKDKIVETGTFHGLQEDFVIDEYGDNTRSYMLDQITKGEYIRIDKGDE